MNNMQQHAGPWICDERVGCVAVYAGELRECLNLPRENFVYYRHGAMIDGHWTVDPVYGDEARRITDAHNASFVTEGR